MNVRPARRPSSGRTQTCNNVVPVVTVTQSGLGSSSVSMWAVPGADPAFAGQVLSFLDSMTLRTGPTFRDKDVNLGRLHLSSDRRDRKSTRLNSSH